MREHVGQPREVINEHEDAHVVVIEGKVDAVRHVHGKRARGLDVRKCGVQGSGLTAGAERVQGDEGGVAQPGEPGRDLGGGGADGEVEVARDLGEAPRENHGGDGGGEAHLRDQVQDAPHEHQAR